MNTLRTEVWLAEWKGNYEAELYFTIQNQSNYSKYIQ